jgi:hypothetical protein
MAKGKKKKRRIVGQEMSWLECEERFGVKETFHSHLTFRTCHRAGLINTVATITDHANTPLWLHVAIYLYFSSGI